MPGILAWLASACILAPWLPDSFSFWSKLEVQKILFLFFRMRFARDMGGRAVIFQGSGFAATLRFDTEGPWPSAPSVNSLPLEPLISQNLMRRSMLDLARFQLTPRARTHRNGPLDRGRSCRPRCVRLSIEGARPRARLRGRIPRRFCGGSPSRPSGPACPSV